MDLTVFGLEGVDISEKFQVQTSSSSFLLSSLELSDTKVYEP